MSELNEVVVGDGQVTAKPVVVDKLKGIGGWLIIPLFGIFLSVIGNFGAIVVSGFIYFVEDGKSIYPILGFGVTFIVLFAILRAFLQTKSYVPKLFIALYIVSVAVFALGAVVASNPQFAGDSVQIIRNFVLNCIGAAIWIPYWLVSKRVKATFVN